MDIQHTEEMQSGTGIPEKSRVLEQLRQGGFNVPEFIYISAEDFKKENFGALQTFLGRHQESFKVIARSAHPLEHRFKGGTFESLETYADIAGIKYARKRIIKAAGTVKRLSILRQQKFNRAPQLVPEEMGIIVMPFIEGASIMAKMIGDHWEFGYSRNRSHKVQRSPYITKTPHDRKLLQLSEEIQKYLGFRCEIEYIISEDNEIHVVQAKDISAVELLEQKESERSVQLDGVRRIRKRRNYRERPIYVMDKNALYISAVSKCEGMLNGDGETAADIGDVLAVFAEYEASLEDFALKYERFGVIELTPKDPQELYQIVNHYLDEIPDLQKQLSKALNNNLYKIDYFLSEADTLIAKDRITINMCTHDAYGIDTVRNPLWSVYWYLDKHDKIIRKFNQLGFKTGDTVGIDINSDEKPTVYRW